MLGLAVQFWGMTVHLRSAGPARKLARATSALTRQQRRELLDQIRGRRPVEPERLALARHLADERSRQVRGIPQALGPLVLCLAVWIGSPDEWFLFFIAALALFVGGVWFVTWRISREARRFLDENPVVLHQ